MLAMRCSEDSFPAISITDVRIDPELAATLAAVADEGTLDAASRRLRVTPSAVSQRLKALEAQLGRILLARSKPVRLTEAGESVVRLARQIALLEQDALAGVGIEEGDGDTASRCPWPSTRIPWRPGSSRRWRASRPRTTSTWTCTATIRTSPPDCSNRERSWPR